MDYDAKTARNTAKFITEYWGERCPDYDPDCPVCKAWAEHDQEQHERAKDRAFMEELAKEAEAQGKSLSGLVRDALQTALNGNQ